MLHSLRVFWYAVGFQRLLLMNTPVHWNMQVCTPRNGKCVHGIMSHELRFLRMPLAVPGWRIDYRFEACGFPCAKVPTPRITTCVGRVTMDDLAASFDMTLLGKGSYGAVFHPAVTCDDEIDTTQVSKVMFDTHSADEEYNAAKILRHLIPPEAHRFFMLPSELCALPPRLHATRHGTALPGLQIVLPYGGMTLTAAMRRVKTTKAFRDVLRPLVSVFLAVEALNRSGLIHFDIKPLNILLRDAGEKKLDAALIDLGLMCSSEYGAEFTPATGKKIVLPAFGESAGHASWYFFWPFEAKPYTHWFTGDSEAKTDPAKFIEDYVAQWNKYAPPFAHRSLDEVKEVHERTRARLAPIVDQVQELVARDGGLMTPENLHPLAPHVTPWLFQHLLKYPAQTELLGLLAKGVSISLDSVDVYGLGCTLLFIMRTLEPLAPKGLGELALDMTNFDVTKRPTVTEARRRFMELLARPPTASLLPPLHRAPVVALSGGTPRTRAPLKKKKPTTRQSQGRHNDKPHGSRNQGRTTGRKPPSSTRSATGRPPLRRSPPKPNTVRRRPSRR